MVKIAPEVSPRSPDSADASPPPTAHGLRRRRVLQVGGGLAAVLAGGTLFRAYDQGVFSTGRGPAYDAWRDWDVQAGNLPLGIVRAAVLAASAHNSQPWLFRLESNRIALYAVPEPRTAQALAGMLPQRGWQAVMPFRLGYPTELTLASPRRPAEEVISG